MAKTNLPNAHHSVIFWPLRKMCSNLIQRIYRPMLLSVLGYVLYFGGTFLVSFLESHVSIKDASWGAGSIVAFGLAASELFVLDGCVLNKSLLRRLILSVSITIASLLIAEPMCMLFGISLREGRVGLLWPRVKMAAPVFAFLLWICHRSLRK